MPKPMTNAEVAKLFAKLPPKKNASIMLIDSDVGSVDWEDLFAVTEEIQEEVDEEKDEMSLGHPCIWRKY